MTLSETGESRIRGYLYVLERSISASASAPLARDAVREVESHIRDRVAGSDGLPNEREALETILARLGSPATVARAYSLELIMEEAAVGGRFVPVLRSIFHAAALGVRGFLLAMLLFLGYTTGLAFIAIAALKPIFPNNVGLWMHEGISLGGEFPAPPGVAPLGGYWIVPICLFVGLLLLVASHRAARRWAARLRDRLRHRPAAALEQT
jgi:uncharacterized membrane protein